MPFLEFQGLREKKPLGPNAKIQPDIAVFKNVEYRLEHFTEVV